ncbi:LysR family transcriptional regulator [Oceanococcus atlanticus]|uniref:LysR family transcriptional regulator n=2 Tax=Gammaproteobacteria TaxID=1236 RepID=A0A1Y1SBM3_9GAMM|nr:LysR family transcriptional regulator [Oceanococcus atlanticus]ORE86018.1 LysR family transcriptional regulator [Oceanococcus atlanticus]
MDTLALKTFVDIAHTGSFSASAERLHISQPAVSKRIAALEQQVGHKLLDRVGRRVMLTEAGHNLLPHAQQVLMTLDDATRSLSRLHNNVSGRLSIGTSHHIGLHRLPPVLRQFTQQFADVDLDIHFMDSEQACEGVLDGALEMAVVTLPPDPDPRLTTQLLWPDPLDVIVGPAHPLAGRSEVKLTTLASYPAVLPDAQTYTHRIIQDALQRVNTQLHVRLATNYLETIKMLVNIGLGWSVLPRAMIDKDIVALRVPGLAMQRELGSVRHRDRATSAAASAFMRTASTCAQDQ